MNYERIYNQLTEKRKVHKLTGYTETHHIQPKSLGGSNSKDNLVELTAKEHFIAHLLLAKFKPCHQMMNAIMIMRCRSDGQYRNDIQNSRMYEWARKEFSKYMKVRTKGVGNSQYGTMWICNIELEENKKISKNDIIPEGWIKGRSVWNRTIKCQKCNTKFIRHSKITRYCSSKCAKLDREVSNEAKNNMSIAQKKRFKETTHHIKGKKRLGLRGKIISGS